MDLVFIDGSHVLEDIEKDWENVKQYMHPRTIVVFDDFWENGWNGDFSIGCNRVIEKLSKDTRYKVDILPVKKLLEREWGVVSIQLVRVTQRHYPLP